MNAPAATVLELVSRARESNRWVVRMKRKRRVHGLGCGGSVYRPLRDGYMREARAAIAAAKGAA